jgi:hypothetical protein
MDNEAYERYIKICELIKGDDTAEQLLNNFINTALDYVGIVVKNDFHLKIQAPKLDNNEYREYIHSLDETRSRKHNALISALHSFNRYLLENYDNAPIGGIYSLPPETIHDRVAVGDWAGRLVFEIFINRKK